MHLIGLTGGIASGKTLVSDRFASLGAPVIDADLLAREVVTPGSPGLNALLDHFGSSILTPTGELDRSALRDIVFANPAERQFLDRTLHPLIRQLSEERIAELKAADRAYAIYAVPLLVETNQQHRFDRIVVVDIPRHLQRQRLLARDSASESGADAILNAQASREERLAVADHVIDNSGTIEQTQAQVDALHELFMTMDGCRH